MKIPKIFQTLFILVIAFSLASCNMPFVAPEPTATSTATPTLPPTETPIPTDTPVPPTETPTVPPVTDTPLPTPIPPTATNTKVPTAAVYYPTPRDFYSGSFENGTLTFRIGPNPYLVIPKSVVLKKAACKEGGTINTTINFEPPPTYDIDDGVFSIVYSDTVNIYGRFISEIRATGSITLKLKKDGKACTVGPLAWYADAVTP